MKRRLKITWGLVALLMLSTIVLLFGSHKNEDIVQNEVDLSGFISELQLESESIFTSVLPISFEDSSNQNGVKLKKQRWYLIQYANGRPSYWNSNKFSLDSSVLRASEFPLSYQFGDDLYIVFKHTSDTYLSFRLANDGKLHKRLVRYYPSLKDKIVVGYSSLGTASSSIFLFESIPKTHFRFLNFALAISCLLLFLMLLYLKRESWLVFLTFLLIAGVQLLVFFHLQLSFDDYFLISNQSVQVVTSTFLVQLCFLHLITIVSAALIAFRVCKTLPHFLFVAVYVLSLLFLSDLYIDLGARLALTSTISFDFEKLFGLSLHSFFALAFISISFISLWTLGYFSKVSISRNNKLSWVGGLIGLIVFVGFQYFNGHRSIVSLGIPFLMVGVVLFINERMSKPRAIIYLYFVLTALVTTSVVFQSQSMRERVHVEEFGYELIANKDTRAESILSSFENELAQEFLTPEDYNGFVFKKGIVENRIKHLYFSNYLEKYELRLFSFGAHGENINENKLYTFEDLDNVYNNNSKRTASAYFYQIDNPISVNGYIAKYENCDIDGHFGTTFILLQPRVVQSEFLYPEVFDNQKSKEQVSLRDFSYGLYFNDELISQKGSYSYQLSTLPSNKESGLLSFNSIRHRSFAKGDYKVVLSRVENPIRSWFSAFTFTLLLLLPLSFLLSLVSSFVLKVNHPIAEAFLPRTSKYLSSRIQTSLTIILLLGLLFSVYIIITFIQANYNQNLESQLLTKVKSISVRLQNKVDLGEKLGDLEQRTLMLNEESSTYNVDINLYDIYGNLLSSTKPYLNTEQILGGQMNPKAYVSLRWNKSSQLLIQEELEGSDYLSAYVPLFDGRNEVIGYLNTPFFAKNEELNKQISNLVVNILNIYFLLLLGGVFLAYIISRQISKPLVLIREKIAKTVLLGENELIVYNRDDEIGQLVKQYNKMVLELEESASQMAESEREGAWREMAKQVAHEIKNPLTPMKLSVQHLQRAYDVGPSEKLDVLFKKTSKLLIEQINSLSNMASEFGNFAQMPEDQFVVFSISEILSSTVDLFRQSENVQIRIDITPNVEVMADPEQIRRVFNNLIKNAIQAIPENRTGEIEISLLSTDTAVSISLKDNGKGIPKENYKKVFVPNFSTKNSGMGLGLAICRKIIESANGKISFVSEIDKGTTFSIILPPYEKT